MQRHRVVPQASTSRAAEAFRLLRTQVLQRMVEHGWRSLAVVAATGKEDRAPVAVNLASAIAADPRHHALVVDLDLRSPRVADLFGLRPAAGVDRVLAGTTDVVDCLYRPDGFERLTLLPAGAPLQRASELLSSRAALSLVEELEQRYSDRYVLYSVAPVLSSDDALAFLPAVDCALLVVTEGTTHRGDLLQAMAFLRRTPLVGSVLGESAAAGRSTE
jgi:Mrp family chromosome partitioning ATPase